MSCSVLNLSNNMFIAIKVPVRPAPSLKTDRNKILKDTLFSKCPAEHRPARIVQCKVDDDNDSDNDNYGDGDDDDNDGQDDDDDDDASLWLETSMR